MSDKKKVDKKKVDAKKPAAKKGAPEAKTHKAPHFVAALKKKLQEENQLKEEAERKEREEQQKFEELKRRKEEEEQKKREKKEKEKQKRKEKKELERKNGTYLTENQKRKMKEAREKHGVNAGVFVNDSETVVKKVVYDNKKKQQKKEIGEGDDRKAEIIENNDVEPEKVESESEDDHVDEHSESSDLDDWENMLDSDEEKTEVSEKTETIEKQESVEKQPQEKPIKTKVTPSETRFEEDTDPISVAKMKIQKRYEQCEREKNEAVLRAPIVCVLGHVDTGKTKILDKLRHTDVQGGETGGITQQIGATNVPLQDIPSVLKAVPNLRLPGLLIIDTPGHESFSNMRVRGSSLCDIAVLVVDLMHGVQEQTKESIKLLRKGKMPFVIALNKIDRLVDWKTDPTKSIKDVMDSQSNRTRQDFRDRLNQTVLHFANVELNVRCFWEDDGDEDYINMVPTSAHSGDGMNDLIAYLCKFSQQRLARRLAFSEHLQASVMEVKETAGHGTTLDVILVNGWLRANDTIVVGGQEGPISTKIRYLLKPAPMSELRVKGEMSQQNECMAAQGVKIVAKDLEKAMPGLPLYVAHNDEEIAYYKHELNMQLETALKSIKLSDNGLYVQTSTIGSLEALLVFLRQQKIPFSGINIGTVHKKDIVKATAIKERDSKWAVILAFNVKVEPEAELMAKTNGIMIFRQEIIYRLFDDITTYLDQLASANKERLKDQVVYPVALKIMPECIFQTRNPILVGVSIESGVLRLGTPLCAQTENGLVDIGRAMSIEQNRHPISEARAGQEVCVRIDPMHGETPKMLGRSFKVTDSIISKITRESIDILKEFYRDELTTGDWKLVKQLKAILGIL